MKSRSVYLTFALAAGIAAATQSSAGEAKDPVAASFERVFDHQPTPAATLTREDIDTDVLYKLVNQTLLVPAESSEGVATESSKEVEVASGVALVRRQ